MSDHDENGYPRDPRHPFNSVSNEDWLKRNICENMEKFERLYKDGNLGGLSDALLFCELYEIPPPRWLTHALFDILYEHLTGEKKSQRGRHARWITRYRENMVDAWRYEAVTEGIGRGIRWLDVYDEVAELLAGTFAAGSADAVEKSYKRVVQGMRDNPGRYATTATFHFPRVKE